MTYYITLSCNKVTIHEINGKPITADMLEFISKIWRKFE